MKIRKEFKQDKSIPMNGRFGAPLKQLLGVKLKSHTMNDSCSCLRVEVFKRDKWKGKRCSMNQKM